jgi:hypothetical protein
MSTFYQNVISINNVIMHCHEVDSAKENVGKSSNLKLLTALDYDL